ncbi:MAG: hypothetical protein RMK67_01020 [Chloroflexota bacterium]|jgi:hypothetical protein|nr:hypothetical protein [Chloroflexota bacterium]
MPRLSQLLRRVSVSEGPPLGFGVAAHRPRATLLLVAQVDGNASRLPVPADAADALLVAGEASTGLRKELKGLDGVPWGVLLPRAEAATVASVREMGADFVAFDPAQSDAGLLLEEGLDLVALASHEASDTELRLLEALPLTALLPPQPSLPLTVAARLSLQRLSALARLPLLVPVPPQADGSLLRLLRDAGAAAVVVEGKAGADALAALRQAIESLPPRPRRREERAEPLFPVSLLPRPGGEVEEEE